MDQETKNHLSKYHEGAAASHVEYSKCFSKMAACHEAVAKSANDSEPETAQQHRDAAAACKAASVQHVRDGESHLEMHKAISSIQTNETRESGADDIKSLISELRKLTIPNGGVSAIPTSMAPERGRVIPRAGQPDREAERAAVDETLRPLILDERQARG
jgi:hypothetical protein